MKPSDREDKRYATKDYCQIRLEEELVFGHLRRLYKTSDYKKLLDIGCGSGLITQEVRKIGYQVKGLDFSPVAIEKAKTLGINATQADLDEGIPEADESYDIVLAQDIIEHVFDPISVISEANRVLRPGGHIIITVPNDVSVLVRLKTLFGISHQEAMYRRSGAYKHHTFFTERLLKYMLARNNFKPVALDHVTSIGKIKQINSPYIPLIFTNELLVVAQKAEKKPSVTVK